MRIRVRVMRVLGLVAGGIAVAIAAMALVFRGPVVRTPERVRDVPRVSPERLEHSVRWIVEELPPRWYTPVENLDVVRGWIAAEMSRAGLEVHEQPFSLPEGEYRNVIARRAGRDPSASVVIIGAHYDAYGALPGADDNASGVAVLLELARTLPKQPAEHPLLLVAFANEEPPLFGSEDMGSHRFLQRLQRDGVEVELMIALDCVGYFSDEPGSQRYPAGWLQAFYPTRGDFIGVVGDLRSGPAIGRVKSALRSATSVPVVSFRGPRWIPGVDWSDHYWFLSAGLPAVLVTDTAMLRNRNYHRRTDTPDTLDYRRMAEVVRGLHAVIEESACW